MSKFTESAKDQMCTFQIPGVCNGDPDTSVLCHLPDGSGTGHMAGKGDDYLCGAIGCSSCHDVIDGRVPMPDHFDGDVYYFYYKARLRTLTRWKLMGLVPV